MSDITQLSSRFVGDSEGTVCRFEFLYFHEEETRFGWVCVSCTGLRTRFHERMTWDDATQAMRTHRTAVLHVTVEDGS